MRKSYILFICRANVGRSQIAEGLYRKYYNNNVLSIAGAETKKEKYHGKPFPEIVDFLRKNHDIDISTQEISYLRDIPANMLGSIRSVYFLYDPKIETDCAQDCMLENMTPYTYFQKQGTDIVITSIEDPFDVGHMEYNRIVEKINTLIFPLFESIDSSIQRSSE